jgi:hypothetical protein
VTKLESGGKTYHQRPNVYQPTTNVAKFISPTKKVAKLISQQQQQQYSMLQQPPPIHQEQQQQQLLHQQQTNNTLGILLYLVRYHIFVLSQRQHLGDHTILGTFRLWLPVSMMSFSHFFVLIQRQFFLFIHSYCHHFGGSFMVELHFYFGHYWGQQYLKHKPTT